MPTTYTKLHVSCTTRSGTRSNKPIPIQVVHLAPYFEDVVVQHEPQEASTAIVHTPRRKIGSKKKLTWRKDVSATLARGTSSKALANPSSPTENTRSKKQLLLEWTKVTPPCCFDDALVLYSWRTPWLLWYEIIWMVWNADVMEL